MKKSSKIGMPYRLSEGEMEQTLDRARRAVAEARMGECKTIRPMVWRWAVAASLVIGVAIAWVVATEQPVTYDEFIAQMYEMPQEVLYDMSIDVVEYELDETFL